MNAGEWIASLPLWAVLLLTTAVLIASVESGSRLAAIALRKQGEKEAEGPLGSMVGAILGLLAFILAFSFGMTASRFDARKQLVLEEANAIGTTYLRADMLPRSQGLEIRKLLREYADVRLKGTIANLPETFRLSEAIHRQLWAQAELLVAENMDSEIRSLFVVSLNELIDLHQSRKTVGIQYRLPEIVWVALYLLSVLSMLAVGYQIGMAGTKRLRGTPVLAAAFSLVIAMIVEIDRPGGELIRVSQQPTADALQMMLDDSP